MSHQVAANCDVARIVLRSLIPIPSGLVYAASPGSKLSLGPLPSLPLTLRSFAKASLYPFGGLLLPVLENRAWKWNKASQVSLHFFLLRGSP